MALITFHIKRTEINEKGKPESRPLYRWGVRYDRVMRFCGIPLVSWTVDTTKYIN